MTPSGRKRCPYFILTDKELAAELSKVRIALTFRRPVTAAHLRCIEEATRRLETLVRVADDDNAGTGAANDNRT